MPVEIEGSIVEVDDVDGRNPESDEKQVIVFDTPRAIEKLAAVTEIASLPENNVGQPRS